MRRPESRSRTFHHDTRHGREPLGHTASPVLLVPEMPRPGLRALPRSPRRLSGRDRRGDSAPLLLPCVPRCAASRDASGQRRIGCRNAGGAMGSRPRTAGRRARRVDTPFGRADAGWVRRKVDSNGRVGCASRTTSGIAGVRCGQSLLQRPPPIERALHEFQVLLAAPTLELLIRVRASRAATRGRVRTLEW